MLAKIKKWFSKGDIYCKDCKFYYFNYVKNHEMYCLTSSVCCAFAKEETATIKEPAEIRTYKTLTNRFDIEDFNGRNKCKYFKQKGFN